MGAWEWSRESNQSASHKREDGMQDTFVNAEGYLQLMCLALPNLVYHECPGGFDFFTFENAFCTGWCWPGLLPGLSWATGHIAGDTSASSKLPCFQVRFTSESVAWVKVAPTVWVSILLATPNYDRAEKQVRTHFPRGSWDIYLLKHTESTPRSLRPSGLDIRLWTFLVHHLSDGRGAGGGGEAGFHNPMNQPPLYTYIKCFVLYL